MGGGYGDERRGPTATIDGYCGPTSGHGMWGVLGQLSRARDAYARSTDREVRASTAAEISRLVELLRGLANALLEESTES